MEGISLQFIRYFLVCFFPAAKHKKLKEFVNILIALSTILN